MLTQSQKPVWWKIILGLVVVYIEIHNWVSPAPNLLKASNPAQQVGMDIAMVAIIAVGCWLIYSGAKPALRKIP
jgi:hypothetical protein